MRPVLGVSLTSLAALVAVEQRGSFSRAAKDLGIDQGAISRQIMRLEARLGVRLLDRRTPRHPPDRRRPTAAAAGADGGRDAGSRAGCRSFAVVADEAAHPGVLADLRDPMADPAPAETPHGDRTHRRAAAVGGRAFARGGRRHLAQPRPSDAAPLQATGHRRGDAGLCGIAQPSDRPDDHPAQCRPRAVHRHGVATRHLPTLAERNQVAHAGDDFLRATDLHGDPRRHRRAGALSSCRRC